MATNAARRLFPGGLAGAMALPHAPALAAVWRSPESSALRSALHACGGPNLSADLACACLNHCPDVALTRTTSELTESYERATLGGASFQEWFRKETTSDFAEARVVRVEGWVISETEFLLFARLGTSA
jgi:hypothetical protein